MNKRVAFGANGGWGSDADYCAPWQVALRQAPGASLCSDPECDLSGGYAHVGLCEPCSCGKEHAVEECPEHRCRCGDLKSERHSYRDGQRVGTALVCLACENDDLTRLARSVGK